MTPDYSFSIPSPLRLILVEDSEHDLIAFRRAISQNRPNTIIDHVYRAEDLLQDLDTLGQRYHLLVTDYKLPGITGLELCRQIIEREVPIPCVILSGAGSEHVVLQAFKFGVNDYLIKDNSQDYLRLLPQFLKRVVRNFHNRRHAQLFQEQRKLVAAISEIFLTTRDDLSPLYEETAGHLARTLHFPVSLILIKEEEDFVVRAVYGLNDQDLLGSTLPLEGTPCWQAINQTGLQKLPIRACPSCPLKPLGIVTCLAVPIRLDDQITGIIVVADRKPHQEGAIHLPTLQIIANHLGRVITQAQDQAALSQYARRTAFLLKLNQLILSARSPRAISQAVLDELQKILPRHNGCVLLVNDQLKESLTLAQAGQSASPFAQEPQLLHSCHGQAEIAG